MKTQFFTRYGTPVSPDQKLTNFSKAQDSAEYTQPKMCTRCGGAGKSDAWRRTGLTCYKCGGQGTTGMETIRVFTEEKLEKLNIAAVKRAEKQQKVYLAKETENVIRIKNKVQEFYANNTELIEEAMRRTSNNFVVTMLSSLEQYGSLTEKQVSALEKVLKDEALKDETRGSSSYVGEVKERLDIFVKVTARRTKEVQSFGYSSYPDILKIITMEDSEGNVFLSMSTSFNAHEGDELHIKGTVKDHKVFDGVKQTQLQRIKVL